MNTLISLALILAVTMIFFFIMVYRKIAEMVTMIKDNKRHLYSLLDWRIQLIQALKQALAQQKDIKIILLDEIDDLYQTAQSVKNKQSREYMHLENAISEKIADINLLFEQYPQLKVNSEANELKENIINIQNDIELTQKAYNLTLEAYNKTKNVFFDSVVIVLFSQNLRVDLPYWKKN